MKIVGDIVIALLSNLFSQGGVITCTDPEVYLEVVKI